MSRGGKVLMSRRENVSARECSSEYTRECSGVRRRGPGE